MTERVLVTGGTGTTGRLVADRLRSRSIEARIASRQPRRADQVRLDWDDPATFAPALDGVDAVYLVAPTDRIAHLPTMRPLLEAAVERVAGPIVLLSASSLSGGGPMMGEVQAWLRMHAPRWTALRPSWFQQNFVTQHRASILAEGCIYSGVGEGRVPFINAEDIAAVAVAALLEEARTEGELLLTGPEALTYDEAAALISSVTGRAVRHCRLSRAELAGRLAGFGLPADYAALLADMDHAAAEGAEDRTTDVVERITGRPPIALGAYLAGAASSFEAEA